VLEKRDRFAGFLNHLPSKVKLFVKNETRARLKLGHESNMLITPHATVSQPSNPAHRQLPTGDHAHFGLGIQRRLCYQCRHIHTNSRPSNGESMKLRILFISLLCVMPMLFVTVTASALAQEEPQSWRLLADKTAASHDNQYIEAFGNVVLDRGDDYIRAEYARYYQSTKWVFLKGNVDAKFQGDFLKAEEAEFDLNTNTGWLKNGQIFMEDPHMYFEGAVLKKTGAETYEFREATITVCDGDRPAWSIKVLARRHHCGRLRAPVGPRFRSSINRCLQLPTPLSRSRQKDKAAFCCPKSEPATDSASPTTSHIIRSSTKSRTSRSIPT
jgi:lipopolysaccharide export system protein LptA